MPSLSEPRCGQPSKSPPRKNKQAFDNAHAATMTSAGPRPPPSLNPNPSNTLQPHPAKSPPPELRSHGSATFPIPATASKQPTSASPTQSAHRFSPPATLVLNRVTQLTRQFGRAAALPAVWGKQHLQRSYRR